jgi:hypothetical protein
MTVGVKATPGALYSQERAPYPLQNRLGRPQDLAWTGEKNRICLASTGFRASNLPVSSPSQYLLRYAGPKCILAEDEIQLLL